MSRFKTKYYVVWDGHAPGVYDSWEDAKEQIDGYPGARFKSFPTQEDAVMAFRGDPAEYMGIFKAMGAREIRVMNYETFPEIRLDAIAVDAACSHNPGPVEYQGVRVGTGERIFHYGPVPGGSNNIGEYLAIIHAAALLAKSGDSTTPIYTDSKTALSWIRRRESKTTIEPNESNKSLFEALGRANKWIKTHNIPNPILKWETEKWGEIPADFGRKK